MQGSLDNPPVVIRQSRWKFLRVTAMSAVFAVPSGWMLAAVPSERSDVLLWLVFALFGCFTIILSAAAVFPGRMVLDRDGLTCRQLGRTSRYRWHDFSEFMIWSPATLSRQVGCRFSQEWLRRQKGWRLSGGLGSFGGQWELRTQDVVDLLNQARTRWGHAAKAL